MRSMRSGAENENEYDEFYYIRCRDTRSSSDSMEPLDKESVRLLDHQVRVERKGESGE